MSTTQIMSKLPNDIIMNIIKLADGGIKSHKYKYSEVIKNIHSIFTNPIAVIGEFSIREWYDMRETGHVRSTLGEDYNIWAIFKRPHC